MTPDEEFDAAVRLHQQGRFADAFDAYQQVVAHEPNHAGALHMMGVLASEGGHYQVAIGLMERALVLDPDDYAVRVNLGNALVGAGRPGAAEAYYREALTLRPGNPHALFGLGNALAALDRAEEAQAAFNAVIAADPGHLQARTNLAALLLRLGCPVEAEDALLPAVYDHPTEFKPRALMIRALVQDQRWQDAEIECEQMLRHCPEAPGAKALAAEVHYNAGNALSAAWQHEDACKSYRRALAAQPDLAQGWNNLANSLVELHRLEEAEEAYREALAHAAGSPEIVSNHAINLKNLGRFAEAEADARNAVALRPDGLTLSNLGVILHARGQVEEAADAFGAALAHDPGNPDLIFHQSVARLALGDYRQGWPGYEARWTRSRTRERLRPFTLPRWHGEPLDGRTILLHAEQGFGDTLQFVRYAPLVARAGGRVVLEVQPALVSLLAGMEGVETLVGRGEPLPDFDLHCPLLSLPLIFGTTVETIPADIPYLRPAAEFVAAWQDRLPPRRGLRIGIVWAGDSREHDIQFHLTDKRRSMSLTALSPILAVEGVQFFSLQVGKPAEQAAAFPALVDLTAGIREFAETAGLIAHLDLVISVDTSVAHLAAGMGKPVWLLSRFDGCWRWLLERRDSPWYPTMTVYRQEAPGDWGPTVARVAADLADVAAANRGG